MMPLLTDGLLLYHGSYTVVERPLLEKCARYKDFGRGFYLTTSKEQARSFARLSTRKARANGILDSGVDVGYVSIYRFSAPAESDLATYVFETADILWLHCVVAHRKEGQFTNSRSALADKDVIIGKIANDQTNAVIVAYMSGLYGPLGSPQADEGCIRLLIPDRLDNQLCFRTRRALSCLEFDGSEAVCL